jgi:hypothetical protein
MGETSMSEQKAVYHTIGNSTTVQPMAYLDSNVYLPISPTDLEKIRAIVRETLQDELHKANMVILSAEEFDALMKRAAR